MQRKDNGPSAPNVQRGSKKWGKILRRGVLATFMVMQSGCVLAPLIDSVSKVGFTRGDRAALLDTRLKDMNHALYWGNADAALPFAAPEGRAELAKQLRARAKDEKVVESKVQGIDLAEDAETADVFMSVKAYRVPFYVVTERVEHQFWEFSMSKGWRMVWIKEEAKKG